MNKCYGVITFWCCLAGFRVGWGLDSSHYLHSYDINIFSSLIILGYLIGLLIGELDLTTLNVSDGVYCLSSGNYVPRESKASFNVDINVLFHDVVLCVQLCTKLGLVYLP
jgi:hypothetical protein